MPNLQQAELIEFVAPQSLKSHPLNVAIYGDDGYQDLIESIKNLGVLQALYVTSKNVILSGHRRWRAAMAAECPTIPIIRMNYTDALDECQAIIEHNRYRIKNGQQLYNESQELERIRDLARQRQLATLPQKGQQGFQYHVVETFPPHGIGKSRDAIAKTIGLGSGRQLDKLAYVHQHKPSLLPQIKPDGISLSRAYIEARKETIKAQSPSTPLPAGVFGVIYADPPWRYDFAQSPSRSIEAHYQALSIDEICHYRDPEGTPIQDKIADDSILFLWAPQTKIQEALQVIREWGFQYKTGAVWVKEGEGGNPQIGMGYYFREQHELLLVGKKGNIPVPEPSNRPPSTFTAPRTIHSRKPALVRGLITTMYPNSRYLEVFGTEKVEGWTTWP